MTSSTARSDDGTFASVAIAFVVGVIVVAVETAASAFLLDHRLTDVVMVYLLGVVLVAMRFGYAPSLFTAAASVAAFDFFFTPPYFSFAVADKRYFVTFAIMLLVAFIISDRTERIRRIASAAKDREMRTAALYAMSRELAVARSSDEMMRVAYRHLREVFHSEVSLLLPEPVEGTGAEAALERGFSPPNFPITPRQLRGDWTIAGLEPGEIRRGQLTLLARQIPHKGGRTFGYRVSDGDLQIAYLADHSPTDLGPGPDGLGAYHDAALELASDVDILMHDSFWYAEDFDPGRTFGHAAAEYAIGLAAAAGARKVLLLHHRPDRTDIELDKLAARLSDSPVTVSLAADGDVIRR